MASPSSSSRTGDDMNYRRTCSYCMKEVGRQNLKACTGCHMVKYCSKKCQKAAWKTHKSRCRTGQDLLNSLAANPDANSMNTALSKWLDHWRGTLCNWSFWALDTANHPPDRLANNWFVIEIEQRPNPPSQELYFQMVGGDIMDWKQFEKMLHDLDCPEDQIQERLSDRRGNETVQIAVICEGMLRFIWYSLREPALQTDSKKKEFSRYLAEDWQDKLEDILQSGKTELSERFRLEAAMKAFPMPTA